MKNAKITWLNMETGKEEKGTILSEFQEGGHTRYFVEAQVGKELTLQIINPRDIESLELAKEGK